MKRQKTRRTLLLLSALLFPITLNYFSPYLIIRGGFEGVLSGSALVFAGMLLSSLFFGRAFCGWVCPAGALQEATTEINGRPAGNKLRYVKYFIWVPWLGAIAAGFISTGGIKRIDALYCTDYGISVSAPAGYIIYFFVVGLIVMLSLVIGRRAACHSICWMAPFMVLGSLLNEKLGLPGLRLRAEAEQCVSCKACEKRCPMSLPVSEMVKTGKPYHAECILCGRCADGCAKGALSLRFGAAQPAVCTSPEVGRDLPG